MAESSARARTHALHEGKQWTISAPTAWDTSTLAGLRAILREDRECTPSSWHLPGYQALVVHRLGEWVYSAGRLNSAGRPRGLPRRAALLHRYMSGFVRNFFGLEIPDGARLGRRVRFMHRHSVVLDERRVIGDDCVFHHGVTLGGRY